MRRAAVRVVVLLSALALAPVPGLAAEPVEEPRVRSLREKGFGFGAELALEVRAVYPSEPCDGDVIDLRVTVENISQDGPGPFQGSIESPVAGGTSYVPGSAGGGAVFDPGSQTISWEGPLAVGESHTIEFDLAVDPGLPPGILAILEFVGTAGAGSIRIDLPIRVCGPGDGPAFPPAPPEFGSWLTSPELPGFEAKVGIFPPGGGLGRLGEAEPECIAETLCVSGALPGRSELFVKVVGPRPNGYLWVQLSRFTPSRVVLWLRQVSTGLVRLYELDAAGPGEDPFGRQDRRAFNP